ncbi:DUF6596 domain-containing protein [Micromonospora sp. NPDC049559]|uniref:RNA polymerase sigma factor n=1 Tax=Micromonospora sp. NPDC049559 TaxID=3155923 RepID=UPI003439AF18
MTEPSVEQLLRHAAPKVLSALVRRHGYFDLAEDCVQEALFAASVQWATDGVPDDPEGWLVRVANRRLIDQRRSEQARRHRELRVAELEPADQLVVTGADTRPDSGRDDTLALLFLCCHPDLPPASGIALTLRAVGGLTTAQIARAFLVPEATMAQRISRAKQRIRGAGLTFTMPPPDQIEDRLRAVLRVLYLIFNEGYTASVGTDLQRIELADEAVRLTRQVYALRPDHGEVTGLLALMLLTDARRAARGGPDGELIPLAQQDRSRWNGAYIREGTALIESALDNAPIGPYQIQAAIAAVHDEAKKAEDTDWPQIVELYKLLNRISPSPVVTLNYAVAVAMAQSALAGLEVLESLEDDSRIRDHHRYHAVRGHLLDMAGDRCGAVKCYRKAAQATTSVPEQRYLDAEIARLTRETADCDGSPRAAG